MRGFARQVDYQSNRALGGTITDSGGYRYHTFTSTDTTGFRVLSGDLFVEYILVGGGGASGGSAADGGNPGGGGGGGAIRANVTLAAGNYPVIIGAGGSGSTSVPNRNGNPSAWTTTPEQTPLTITLTGYRRTVKFAADGLALWLGSNGGVGTSPWQTYRNLPTYLKGLPCTVEINQSDTGQFTSNKSVRVYLIRDTTFVGVTLTGWTLYESGKNYITSYDSNVQVYYQDFAAGTYTIDNNSALYMFEDLTATTKMAVGGGFGGSFGLSASPGDGGSGGGFAQVSTYLGTTTADVGMPGVADQGNKGGFHTRASTSQRPLSGQGGGGAGTRGGLNTLTNYTAKNSSGSDLTYVVTGSSAGDGVQWLDGNYYAGGGGGSTHEWYPQGDWSSDTRTGTLQQPGGLGGGGDGRYLIQEMPSLNNVPGTNGSANTGGGGGGSGPNAAGTNGGSGILIVRYAI